MFAAAGAVVLAVTGTATAARRPPPAPPPAATQSFAISGSVDGVHPGGTSPISVTIANPYAFAIVVTELVAEVGDAADGCGPENLAVVGMPLSVRIGAGSTAVVTVHARMPLSAADACQAQQFPIAYRAVARRAR